jgi:aminoglycoside phosphotransferase (APT) family kinase protein
VSAQLDEPRAVRSGEELPIEALQAYLDARLPGLGAVTVEQFPSGYSNLTYLLRAGERELVLRRPPFGAAVKTGHDMGREHRILAALHPVWPKAPRPVLACADESVLGAPFYLMERVRGVILRGAPGRPGPPLAPEQARRASEALIDTLAELHALDFAAAGLRDLGRPEGYVARQVQGWSERYANARTDDVPEVERLAAWLAGHVPAQGGAALIHNDYKFDNVVFDPGGLGAIRAVLDWEMATLGDPLLDLGTTLAYWADRDDPEEWRQLSVVPVTLQDGSLDRAGVVERYARASGLAPDAARIVFAYAYGLFKVAVIAQQIFARFRRGHTQDARFSGLGRVVRACGRVGLRAVELKRIERLAD